MKNLRIAAVGLLEQDSLVLRSTVRFLENGTFRWSYVENDNEADVVLRVLTPTRSENEVSVQCSSAEPRRWLRIDVTATGAGGIGANLMLPLRARELIPLLRSVEDSHLRWVQRHGSNKMSLGRKDFVNFMLSDASSLGTGMTVMKIGIRDDLLIDAISPNADGDVRTLRWRSWSMPNLGSFCDQLRDGAPVSLELVPQSQVGATEPTTLPLSTGTVRQLIWALATYDAQPEGGFSSLDETQQFVLLRWPDFGDLPLHESQLRLAALLARGPLSLEQLVMRSKMPEVQVISFLNGCYWLGYLAIKAIACPLQTPPSQPQRATPSVSRPTHGWAGLLELIRSAIRASVVREAS